MQLVEVTNSNLDKEFLLVNVELNKNNPAYIRPLDKDIYEVFDKKKNKTFRQGEVIRWILKDDEGKFLGRIAAFTNKKYKNKGDDVPVGGIGFFDCINDQVAADMLFNVAKHWLMQKGMQAMDGPINFGERDRWWGLVVKGTDLSPMYCMNFNPPYYQQLFENYGFKNYFNQICFALQADKLIQQKFFDRHDECEKDPNYQFSIYKEKSVRKIRKGFYNSL